MVKCELCGEPMPAGEEMFKYHGYSGPCQKPPLSRPPTDEAIWHQLADAWWEGRRSVQAYPYDTANGEGLRRACAEYVASVLCG